jgi:hypothetical protein
MQVKRRSVSSPSEGRQVIVNQLMGRQLYLLQILSLMVEKSSLLSLLTEKRIEEIPITDYVNIQSCCLCDLYCESDNLTSELLLAG